MHYGNLSAHVRLGLTTEALQHAWSEKTDVISP